MPVFNSREEYEAWKAQRLKESQGKGQAQEPLSRSTAKVSQAREPKTSYEEPIGTEKPPGAPGGLSGIGDLFSRSWAIYKRRIGVLILLYILSALLSALSIGIFMGGGLLLSTLLGRSREALIVLGGMSGFLAAMITLSWTLAAVICAVADDQLGIKDALGRGWEKVWAFLWFFSTSGFILTGGFLLFVIPGILFLVWFAFSQFIVASEDERGLAALLKSKEYVRGHGFEVFVRLFLIWIICAVLGTIPVVGPIFAIFFMPFMMIYLFLIYEDLKELKGSTLYSPTQGQKFKWVGAGALGYVALPVIIIAFFGASLTVNLFPLKNLADLNGQRMTLSPKGWQAGKVTPQPSQNQRALPSADQGTLTMRIPVGERSNKAEATGEAIIVRDGVQETFLLKTGFFSETRFADPTKAKIEFQIPADKHSNARRIEIALNATKAGNHYVDGKAMTESMFGRSTINIGEPTPNGSTAAFQYIADGGQIFPPEESCTFLITSPYQGSPDGIFAGELSDCVVHSAGINYHIASVKFTVRGVPSR
jgi:hypothetical protein